MDREFISERYNAQEPAAELWHRGPEAKAIVLLRLAADRVLNDANAHLLREIRPAWHHIVLEVICKSKVRHAGNLRPLDRQEAVKPPNETQNRRLRDL